MHHLWPYTVAINESYGQLETNVGIDGGKWQKSITPTMNKAELVLPTCISKWQVPLRSPVREIVEFDYGYP